MNVELLYFNGCPSWEAGLKNLQEALRAGQINAEIQLILIESDDEARTEKFLGSPSFRINGQDLWPEERESYHLGCRVYATENGLRGAPTVSMLRSKINGFKPGMEKL